MIVIRNPDTIYQAHGKIRGGTFRGRWHFSFGEYHDSEYIHFGTLRVFNDDIFSPGAIWPLHHHRENEIVTYCVDGEFRHADEHGLGEVLKKGWVQHTIGRGIWHSEINNCLDTFTRIIQMWFSPLEHRLKISIEQKAVEKTDRMNRFLPLVSNTHPGALRMVSDAAIFSCFLVAGKNVNHTLIPGQGAYLYVVNGGPVAVNDLELPALGAAKVVNEAEISVKAKNDAELLLVDVLLI